MISKQTIEPGMFIQRTNAVFADSHFEHQEIFLVLSWRAVELPPSLSIEVMDGTKTTTHLLSMTTGKVYKIDYLELMLGDDFEIYN